MGLLTQIKQKGIGQKNSEEHSLWQQGRTKVSLLLVDVLVNLRHFRSIKKYLEPERDERHYELYQWLGMYSLWEADNNTAIIVF